MVRSDNDALLLLLIVYLKRDKCVFNQVKTERKEQADGKISEWKSFYLLFNIELIIIIQHLFSHNHYIN